MPRLSPTFSDPSYLQTLERFSTERAAVKYPAKYRNTKRDRREVRAILNALSDVPHNSHVLDLPCGSGRLLPILVDRGHRVTCADSSATMVRLAESQWREVWEGGDPARPMPRFVVADIMQTQFGDREFDAVICNRLFHHFTTSETRIQAMRELRRICKGPVVISFFNSFAVDALRWYVRNAVRRLLGRNVRTDRKPISMHVFRNDLQRAGLEIVRTVAVFYGLSPMWYVIATAPGGPTYIAGLLVKN